jgi:hypothetical protein
MKVNVAQMEERLKHAGLYAVVAQAHKREDKGESD